MREFLLEPRNFSVPLRLHHPSHHQRTAHICSEVIRNRTQIGEAACCALSLAMISHNQPEAGPSTRIYHTVIPSPLPSSPSFVFQLTRLRDTLMIWVGTGAPTSELTAALTEEEGEGEGAKDGEEIGKRLAADWAVATPSRGVS